MKAIQILLPDMYTVSFSSQRKRFINGSS